MKLDKLWISETLNFLKLTCKLTLSFFVTRARERRCGKIRFFLFKIDENLWSCQGKLNFLGCYIGKKIHLEGIGQYPLYLTYSKIKIISIKLLRKVSLIKAVYHKPWCIHSVIKNWWNNGKAKTERLKKDFIVSNNSKLKKLVTFPWF